MSIVSMKISKTTKKILSKVMDKFLFEYIEYNTVNKIKSYVSELTQIPQIYIHVSLIKENKLTKIKLGYCVSEFEYQEFIIG